MGACGLDRRERKWLKTLNPALYYRVLSNKQGSTELGKRTYGITYSRPAQTSPLSQHREELAHLAWQGLSQAVLASKRSCMAGLLGGKPQVFWCAVF